MDKFFIAAEQEFLKNVLFKFDFELNELDATDQYYNLEIVLKGENQISPVIEELKLSGCINSPFKDGALIKSLINNINPNLPGIGINSMGAEPQMVQYQLTSLS